MSVCTCVECSPACSAPLAACSFHAATLLLSRRQAQAQKASPEYKTAKAVIEAKRRQIQGWQAALQARRQRGAAKVDAKGQYADRESRMLLHHITTTTRPVEMDEAEQKVRGEGACVWKREVERGLAGGHATLGLLH